MSIYGEAKLNYKTSEIQSANIFLDFENYNIVADLYDDEDDQYWDE